LPPGEACRLGAIGINAREFLPVRIVDGYLPVTMPSPPVFAQRSALFGFLQGFFQLWPEKYLKFYSPPQVLVQVTHQPWIWRISGVLRTFCVLRLNGLTD
jgi:hypothetical protein